MIRCLATLVAICSVASAAVPSPTTSDSVSIRVIPGQRRVSVRLSRFPLTRTRANFDCPENGEHREVEWDPNRPGALVAETALTKGTWYLSFWSEPLTAGVSATSTNIVAWEFAATHEPLTFDWDDSKPAVSVGSLQPTTVIGAEVKSSRIDVEVGSPKAPRQVGESKQRLSLGSSAGEGRSLESAIPEQVNEFLQILAEIAANRARAKALQLISDRLRSYVCDDLQAKPEWQARLGLQPGPLLPHTCDVISHLRLQDIAGSAKALLSSLALDVVSLTEEIVIGRLRALGRQACSAQLDDPEALHACQAQRIIARLTLPIAEKVLPLAEQVATDRSLSGREAQQQLVELSRTEWPKLLATELATLLPELYDEAHSIDRLRISLLDKARRLVDALRGDFDALRPDLAALIELLESVEQAAPALKSDGDAYRALLDQLKGTRNAAELVNERGDKSLLSALTWVDGALDALGKTGRAVVLTERRDASEAYDRVKDELKQKHDDQSPMERFTGAVDQLRETMSSGQAHAALVLTRKRLKEAKDPNAKHDLQVLVDLLTKLDKRGHLLDELSRDGALAQIGYVETVFFIVDLEKSSKISVALRDLRDAIKRLVGPAQRYAAEGTTPYDNLVKTIGSLAEDDPTLEELRKKMLAATQQVYQPGKLLDYAGGRVIQDQLPAVAKELTARLESGRNEASALSEARTTYLRQWGERTRSPEKDAAAVDAVRKSLETIPDGAAKDRLLKILDTATSRDSVWAQLRTALDEENLRAVRTFDRLVDLQGTLGSLSSGQIASVSAYLDTLLEKLDALQQAGVDAEAQLFHELGQPLTRAFGGYAVDAVSNENYDDWRSARSSTLSGKWKTRFDDAVSVIDGIHKHRQVLALWNKLSNDGTLRHVACGVELAFAVIAECHVRGTCDARNIAALLGEPAKIFYPDGGICWRKEGDRWTYLNQSVQQETALLVGRALDLISPNKSATPRSLLRDAFDLSFDIVEMVDRIRCRDGSHCADIDKQHGMAGLAPRLRAIVNAAIEHDIQPILVEGIQLVLPAMHLVIDACPSGAKSCDAARTTLVALERATPVLGAVSSYAATYLEDAKGDPKRIEAQHEARKRAVESLVDSATDRRQRDASWIFSIGANVGLASGYQWAFEGATYTGGYIPQLQLPIGLAIQRLPDGRDRHAWWLARHLGFHAQLSFLDVAQYIAMDGHGRVAPLQWQNIFTIAAQAGFLIGSASAPIVVAADARWSPSLFCGPTPPSNPPPVPSSANCDSSGAFRIGVTVSYYVPFFDFN